ncbi:MAG: polyprenyl synthetase family protein [Bacteroidales bacterium]|nr:polyprenyl synthetase family protein [Bacteroidales bacterium]
MITELELENAVSEMFSGIEFPNEPKGLYDPLRYMIGIGGKRVRPLLCLTTYSLFKDHLDQDIIEPARALEVFHSFTLIHDDIMDKSPLRRGEPTVWKKWNPDTAILSGDVMLIDSYKRICTTSACHHASVFSLFNNTAAQVCEGQQLDMDFEEKESVPMEEYEKMIGLKTAVLLACSAQIGAIIGGADEFKQEALYRYGYELGMAFQVADDYLDTFGDEKVFGKPIGGDIVNNKKSWLLTRAFEKSADKSELLSAMALPVDTREQKEFKIDTVKNLYSRLGVDEDAKAEILRFSDRALDAIHPLHLSPVRQEILKRFETKLIGRVK